MRLLTIKRGSDGNIDVSAHNTMSFNVLILDEYDSRIKTESRFSVIAMEIIVCSICVLILINVKSTVFLICR